MKGILIFLAAIAICMANTHLTHTDFAVEEPTASFVDFVKGFLQGINENGDINKLMQCIKNGEDIMAKIKEALQAIAKKDIMNIIKGVTLLIDAIQQLMHSLQPCMEGFNQLKKLFEALQHVDIKKIAMKIFMNLSDFISDVVTAIACFQSGDLQCAGKNVGDILRRLFLSRAEVGEPIVDFITGFLLGIQEKKTIEDLLECMKDADKIMEKIMQAIKLIVKLKLEDMLKGVSMLFEAILELEIMLRPCMAEFTQLQKLKDAIAHANILAIVMKIMRNPGPYIQDFNDCLEAFENGDYKEAGQDIGDILFRIFLVESVTDNKIVDFLKGFLEGLNEKGDINELLKCLKDVEHIIADMTG